MKSKEKKIELSTPWERGKGKTLGKNVYYGCDNIAHNLDRSESEIFIAERTRLHALYIKEQEKTKRISLLLAVVFILIAVVLLIFAPEGKETLSYIVCVVLFIFAAGAVGYGRIKGKIPFTEFEADNLKK